MKNVIALIAGLIFGIGLLLSGMINPQKVLGFLDVAGRWDPSLIFVMGGALAISTITFAIARRRNTSILGERMEIPRHSLIDKRLLGGAVIFGIGWGIAGICPGPAVVLGGSGSVDGWIYLSSMIAGMALFNRFD